MMGLITVKLHNRYHNIQLPQVLGFFGGSRFVPIVTAFQLFCWISFLPHLANFPTMARIGR